jgi:hypothetical protein
LEDILYAEDSNLKCVNRLNVAGDRGVKSLMVDNRRSLEEGFDGSTVEKVECDAVHRFADEGASKGVTPLLKVFAQFGVEGFGLRERVNLEVDSSGVMQTGTKRSEGQKVACSPSVARK